MKEFARKIRLLTLCSLALYMLIPVGTAFAATPDDKDKYGISVTEQTVTGQRLDIAGLGWAEKYSGQLDQHDVYVNWGDGTESLTSTVNFIQDPDDKKKFSGTWSNSHDYSAGGTYTVKVKLYHGQHQGADASDDAEVVIEDVVIPPVTALTVYKIVENNDGAGTKVPSDFMINVTGTDVSSSSFTGSSSGTTVTLAPGAYSVDESDSMGYLKTIGEDCSGTIAEGETKECVITNTYQEPEPTDATLTVVKMIINDNEGTADVTMFPLYVTNTATQNVTNVMSGIADDFASGSYVVTEDQLEGYTGSFPTADDEIVQDCDSEGNVTLEPGDNKVCTILNNDVNNEPAAPTLTVTKVVNGGGYQVSQFPLYVCPVADQQLEASITTVVQVGPCENNVVSGENNTYEPGQYKVSETYEIPTLSSMYVATFSGDCDAQGNITLEEGDAKTCTITNTARSGGGGGGGIPGGGSTGGSSGGGGGYVPPVTEPEEDLEGEVLGVTAEDIEPEEPIQPEVGEVLGDTACSAYLNEYIHIRKKNNPDEVVKLKIFLNEYMDLNLVIDGNYDTLAFEAVLKFQSDEFDEVLKPWGINKATGYVYKTTLRRINMIKCSDLNLPMPYPLVADTNIHDNF